MQTADGGSCVETMTVDTLARRAFAFDGVVRTVTPALEAEDAQPDDMPSYPVAEFEVLDWFAGGDGGSVSVKVQREVAPGQRLLVSGEPLFGGGPLDNPIAWECGFTVEDSDPAAATWRAAW